MRRDRIRVVTLRALVLAAALAMVVQVAAAAADVRFSLLRGFDEPRTPAKYDKVGVLAAGDSRARNVLVLSPGTSASASYFLPLANDIVRRAPDWQVWAVERRENLLEDQSVFDRAKRGDADGQEVFDYYLGYLGDPTIENHFEDIPTSRVAFAREWGLRTEIMDLRRVVKLATKRGGKVVLGGHSLGGTITTAYATWDFGSGKVGADDLSGLVYIDGGSRLEPITAQEATASLQRLQSSSPWLAFGGIPAPLAGVFNTAGSLGALLEPDEPSIGQASALIPAFLKPPVRVTNRAQYGYALDTETSPRSLIAAQAHLGRLAPSGDPRGWVRAGELTSIVRYAKMFAGWGLKGLDGTAWYHPQRLTNDAGTVANGNANPAQEVLDVRATKGSGLPKGLRIYAFGAALGGQRVLDAARALAAQSAIPRSNLTLVDHAATYSHNDPNSASPENDFVRFLVPFLRKTA